MCIPALIISLMYMFNLPNKLPTNLENLTHIASFMNNNQGKLILGSTVVILLYLIIRKSCFRISLLGNWENSEYIHYLKNSWIKYFNQEENKQFIFNALKSSCDDHNILMLNWRKFYNLDQSDKIHLEYLIKVLFNLLEYCVEKEKDVAVDHIIDQLRNMFDENKVFVTEYIEREWGYTYIQKSLKKISKRIYAPCAISQSYDINKFYVRFNNMYNRENDITSYENFFMNKDIELIKKMRIIWLIYENDPYSDNCTLKSIKKISNIDDKLSNLIDTLLYRDQKREEVKSGQEPKDEPSMEDAQ